MIAHSSLLFSWLRSLSLAQRTHTEEFYEVTNTGFEIAELNRALSEWERVYNTVRPHQALGYLSPQEFLKLDQQNKRKEEVALII